MTPDEAADLAARILAVIPTLDDDDTLGDGWQREVIADHRERVESDLAGLRAHEDCGAWHHGDGPCADERRYADGLRRTASLYGVEVAS